MADLKNIIALVAPKADPRFLRSIPASLPMPFDEHPVLARLLANMHHETMGFTKFVENMNYSAKRLTQVWPSRFPTLASAQPYADNPQALANKVYANRMGNGSAASGDGWNFRGGGGLHHTGRAEYDRIQKTHGFSPDAVRDPSNEAIIFAAARSYFTSRNVVAPARARDDETVTRRINGGLIGHQDRVVLTRRYEAALQGWKVPAEHTRTETVQRQQNQGAVAVLAGSAGGAGTTTVVQPPAAIPAPSDSAAIWIGACVILFTVLVVGWGVSRLMRAAKIKAELDAEEMQAIDAKAAMEGAKS